MCLTWAQNGQSFHYSPNKQPEGNTQPLDNPYNRCALKSALERNPFEVWYFKDKFKSFEDMSLTSEQYNNQFVERRTMKGRLQNVMKKALLGQNIGVTVMGGSISAGGGLINDYSDLKGIYYRVFIDWWQKAIQPFTGSNIELHNLAVGGTGSNFFSFCYKTLMKPEDSIDLIFLEFSINDYALYKNSSLPRAMSIEKLTRQLLSEESSPVVMFVNFICGDKNVALCDNLENNGQTMLAWHYGITSFSMRDSLCPNTGNKKFPMMFSSDGNHASIIAHAQIAMMIINSVRDALRGSIECSEQGFHLPSHDLPRSVYFMNDQAVIPDPLCYTLITPDVTSKFFNPSLSVREIENVGFKQIKDVSIGFHRISSGEFNPEPSRTDGYGGWEAEKENSILKLQIDLPFGGRLSDNVTRAVVIVFRTYGYGGKAEVWLEGYKPGIVADAYSPFGLTLLTTVAHHVTSGSHVLSIKVTRAGKFTFCGVMAGAKYVT
ncbi:hypothetical protein OS493_006862 [Desmophyllum pertusum]|uniref:SGNH hydrolase-type esterase domain-containing protein n=1 Tax=Desmophyllum pertusum TaxID=174260 RepID=A0A9X0D4B9_9CNID|nr:hypothetical protein OS493_006862 [Desmophyllum pertusum]